MSDLISRQDVFKAIVGLTTYKTVDEIKTLCDASVADSEGWLGGIRDALRAVEHIPSAEPKRKKGKWIITSKFEDCSYIKCSQCKITQVFYYNKPLTNFCPNCGAKMKQ